MKQTTGYDDCEQLEILFIPDSSSDNVTAIREAFEECNMLNPDTDDSQDEDEEELFTKEYFDQIDSNQ